MTDTVTLNVIDEVEVFSFAGERLTGESFDDYKTRQKKISAKQHQVAKGKLIWDSRAKGTFIKEKHSELIGKE